MAETKDDKRVAGRRTAVSFFTKLEFELILDYLRFYTFLQTSQRVHQYILLRPSTSEFMVTILDIVSFVFVFSFVRGWHFWDV